MESSAQYIPKQFEGEKTDVWHSVNLETTAEAYHLYLSAKDKLKDVSNWHQFSGPGSSKFSLTDNEGNVLYRMAEKGDHFSINLPSPGSLAGDGLEWVRIESLEEVEEAEAETFYIVMTVRPVANPRNKKEPEIAHFFDHASTNTFIVEQFKTLVSAAAHGRNEKPNNKDVGMYDSIRNTVMALGARNGLSGPQWKALMKGLLNKD